MVVTDPFFAVPALLTLMLVLQLGDMAGAVGKARYKFEVKAPKTTGPPGFDAVFRAHQNSLEFFQLVLPALWIAAFFTHPLAVALPGLMYWYFRGQYFKKYSADPATRSGSFHMCVMSLKMLATLCFAGVAHTVAVGAFGFDAVAYVMARVM